MKFPSISELLSEAKSDMNAPESGIYLIHNGVVRAIAKDDSTKAVKGMILSYDREKLDEAVNKAKSAKGINYLRVFINEGDLKIGDDIMLVLIGGDTRKNAFPVLETLLTDIKTNCVTEKELY
ncbi:MAG: molybdenum cofactor biosynthesis protein MoaE [Clostridiales bacterium]|nr:molybdenum cofactor biosynthesis protein MoaE [Clostridiales bacterium]